MKNSFFSLMFILSCSIALSGQHQSIHLNVYGSDYLGNNLDDEYDYETVFASVLAQVSFDYHYQVGQKITMFGSAGFSYSTVNYANWQTQSEGGTLEDRTFHKKEQRISFLKVGTGISYWFNSIGKGPYAKGEVLGNFILVATSKEEKQVEKDPTENFEVSYKDDINSFVPSFKIGVGYNLILKKRFGVNVGLFFDLRTSSYFRDDEAFNFFNKGFEFGIGYILNSAE